MTVASLLTTLENEWRVFRAAIRNLGRAGLGEAIGGDGWTYKDLVAHTAAWMELIPRRLAEIRRGTFVDVAGPVGIDAMNQQAVEERRLVGPEAILDELDSAYRLAQTAIGGLTDADLLDPRVVRVVTATTYLHFAEHHVELGIGGTA